MSAAESKPVIRVDVRDGVAEVLLDRPESRNALNLPMCHQLRAAFADLDSRPDVNVVLVRGAGPAFCAGADLKERKGRDAEWVRQRRIAAFDCYAVIERCSRPVIAAVHGPVVGSGGEIAMACDFAVAAAGTTFRFPEAHWGTVGATQRLQRVIGKRLAKELLFTNRVMSVDEALQRGLVARVLDGDEFAVRVREIAASVAAAPRLAMMLTKQAVDLGSELGIDGGIRVELAAIERCLDSSDWNAGYERFQQSVGSTARADEGARS